MDVGDEARSEQGNFGLGHRILLLI